MKLVAFLSPSIIILLAAFIPDNYQLLFSEDFEGKQPLRQFEMTDKTAWKMAKRDKNRALSLYSASEYEPRVRSPRNIAMLSNQMYGSFVMEAELMQTGREYGHRDMCLFFGMKDPSNFYYVHLASIPDPHAHNIFLVNDEPRIAIGEKVSDGVDWGEKNQWHKVKIERTLEDGSIKVYFDDMTTPIMEATDTHFTEGYIGFGSFDDTGMIDNIKIWGPKASSPPEAFFVSSGKSDS
ncbi:MAG: hypothetical protein RIG62_02020 [Cyclobacteriaceae bacterium]